MKKAVYLDHASTTFPKPDAVYDALICYARQVGVVDGRGISQETILTSELMDDLRQGIAELLHAPAEGIVFCSGATEALNTLLLGVLRPGDHVIASPFEHNAVTRPLAWLREHRGVRLTRISGSVHSGIDPEEVRRELRPETRVCVVNHVSNVFGTVAPLAEIGRILASHERALFLVDGAQSLGSLPIDVQAMGIDLLCFAGHKGLLGPTGTGGFFIGPRLAQEVEPLKFGGTGVRAGAEPYLDTLPHKFEVGTQNTWGMAGLLAGVRLVIEQGPGSMGQHIDELVRQAVLRLAELDQLRLHLPARDRHHGVLSMSFANGLPPVDAAMLLDNHFGLKLRAGLHCSPWAHELAGTLPLGTLRVSFGHANRMEDVGLLCDALRTISAC